MVTCLVSIGNSISGIGKQAIYKSYFQKRRPNALPTYIGKFDDLLDSTWSKRAKSQANAQ